MPLRSTLVLGTFSLCTSPRSVVAAFSNRTLTLSLSEICCKITTFYSNTQTQIARIHTIFAEIVEKHHFSAFIFAYFDKKLYLCTQIVSFMKKLLNVREPNVFARYVGAEEIHPLISVIHFDELEKGVCGRV